MPNAQEVLEWMEWKEREKKLKENMTNEEWLHTLNTEQLAKQIYNFVWCSNELWQQLCCNGDGTDEESDLKIIVKWLKQPHTDN